MSDQLKLRAQVEELDTVLGFLDKFLEERDCSMKAQMQLDIAVEEIFVNIAHYAYETEGGGDASIELDFDEESNQVSVEFTDCGIPYDPLAKPDPDVTLSVEERQIGGLGIYMVKKSMDDMKYRREDDKNILTLYKKIS